MATSTEDSNNFGPPFLESAEWCYLRCKLASTRRTLFATSAVFWILIVGNTTIFLAPDAWAHIPFTFRALGLAATAIYCVWIAALVLIERGSRRELKALEAALVQQR